jgi:hypothetical protein
MREILILDRGSKRDRFEVRACGRIYIMSKVPELVRKVRELTDVVWIRFNIEGPDIPGTITGGVPNLPLFQAAAQSPPEVQIDAAAPNERDPNWLETSNSRLAEIKQRIHPPESI